MIVCACPAFVREGDGKGASLIQGARGRDVTAMGPGNGPGQAKTQSDAGLGPALIASVESLKNAGKIARRNTDPVSLTETTTCASSSETETFTDPPDGVYLMALSRRLESIR